MLKLSLIFLNNFKIKTVYYIIYKLKINTHHPLKWNVVGDNNKSLVYHGGFGGLIVVEMAWI